MTKENDIKILISCHKPTAYIENDILKPIQLGCDLTDKKLPGMLYDNQGDNISDLNPAYCELTAQYWAWKNLDADYYGFCHYRRYFHFSDKKFKEDPYGNIVEEYPGEYIIDKYGLSEENIRAVVEGYDIIITERKDIRKMPGHYASIFDHYERAPYLVADDIHRIVKIIDEKFPEYSKYAHRFCKGHVTSFCNMYILKKDIFRQYCEWLFAVLGEFYKDMDVENYSIEALRTPGHLSERLFGIFLMKLQAENPKLKIKELQCVYFLKTDPQELLKPAFSENNIPIVFAANDDFVPVFATCLQSVINTSSPEHNYDVVLIQTDLSKENRELLLEMISAHTNFSLRFFDATPLLANYKLEAREHISVETYYRFLIQDIMPDYDKVLYVDCDTIICRDLAELYHTDVDGYLLAATRDPDFVGQVNGANKVTKKYAKRILKLQNPYNYFQAGVILFNEQEMKKLHTIDEWLELATYPYRYSDQDVLNVACEGRVKYLDMRWNMIVDCNRERIRNVIAYAPAKLHKEYLASREDPYIIHYAGFMKPWHNPTEDFAHVFWEQARKTPFYEVLIYRMNSLHTEKEIAVLARNVSFKGRQVCRAKRLYRKFFKEDSYADYKVKKLLGRTKSE